MSVPFAFLQAAGGGGQVAEIARTFGVDWPHLGAQIVSFGIVLLVLYSFAYKRILAMLEQRRQQIAQGLANAEKLEAELRKTEAQREEVMAEAYAKAAALIQEAKAAAARVRDSETRKASAAAEQIVLKAHHAVGLEHDRMLAELKREMVRLVTQATAKVAGRVLTPEDHRRLAEQTVKELAA